MTGAELAGGQCHFAPVVIANIAPRQVFGEMMDPAESPTGYRRRLDWLPPSDKSISISFVADLDLRLMGFAFENLIFDSWNEDRVERDPFKGQVGFTSLLITTTIDHDLAPTGQHMVSDFGGHRSKRRSSQLTSAGTE